MKVNKSRIITILIAFSVAAVVAFCITTSVNESAVTTYQPTFSAEAPTCGDAVTIDANSVQFGSDANNAAGRVVSNQGYTGISQIRATVDFSHLSSDFVINTFYMINNPNKPGLQPLGPNYCDAGGNNPGWNCQEVDFFEANKNVVLQHTMHIGDGSQDAPQNYQYSYTSDSEKCYPNLKPGDGINSWGDIKVGTPVNMVVDLDENGMTMTLSQDGANSVVVYKMGPGYSGSTDFDATALARWEKGRQQGYWLLLSQWQWDPSKPNAWAPGSDNGYYDWNCPWGNLCGNNGDWFKVYDIEVDATGVIAPVVEQPEGYPATVELTVINNTDKPIYWHRLYGMDAKDVYDTIPVNGKFLSNSNTHNATSFEGKIWPPSSVTKPSPDGGSFDYEYGYWNNTMHINNANDGGGPMPGNATTRSANWVYEIEWLNDPKTSINNTATFTTSKWPK